MAKKKPEPKRPHVKKEAREAIREEAHTDRKNDDRRYSAETLRSKMSTGGGTPIKKGHKWTTEHRVLQPRDPDTGHFTYNADAELDLKYKSHGKANADPVALKNWKLNGDIKKGDVVKINGETWIAIEDIPFDKVKDFFRRFDNASGEFYSYGELPSKATVEDAFTEIAGRVRSTKFSDFFVKKQGRMSKAEREGEGVVGHVDLDTVGERTKEEIKKKMDSMEKGFYAKYTVSPGIAVIDPKKKAANEEHNRRFDAAIRATAAKLFSKMSFKPGATAGKPAEAAKPATAGMGATAGAEAKPEAPAEGPKPGTAAKPASKAKAVFGDTSMAKSNPSAYYAKNKGLVDGIVKSLEKDGMDVTIEEVISYIGDSSDEDLEGFLGE